MGIRPSFRVTLLAISTEGVQSTQSGGLGCRISEWLLNTSNYFFTQTMSESELQRIRQVAAAIAQMDADSAEQLIAHFPKDLQAKVRKEIERIQVESVVVSGSDPRAAMGQGTVSEMGQGVADRVTQGGRATQGSRAESHESARREDLLEHPVQSPLVRNVEDFVWLESYTSEQLASSLATLRPVVAAMILKHLPLEIGTRIVQLLPSAFARTCLNSIQNLHSAHPEACSIVLSQWRSELADQVGRQTIEQREDEKVRELLKALGVGGATGVSDPTQGAVAQSHGLQDVVPGAPSDLGSGVEAAVTVIPMVPSASVQAASIPGVASVANKGAVLGASSNTSAPSSNANQVGGVKQVMGSAKSRLHDSGAFVIPIDRKLTRNELLRDLLQLEDVELLRVLYQHEPKVVLSFLAGAGKPLRQRIEQLTAPKLLAKLRRELASHLQPSDEEWRGIAAQINQSLRPLHSVDGTMNNTGNRVSA